jgi:hypothetical protein
VGFVPLCCLTKVPRCAPVLLYKPITWRFMSTASCNRMPHWQRQTQPSRGSTPLLFLCHNLCVLSLPAAR